MKYYKYIDVDNWQDIPYKTRRYLRIYTNFAGVDDKNWLDLDLDHYRKFVPEVFEIFKPYNLTIDFIAAIKICRPSSFIHVDTTNGTDHRVNIPVSNYLNTLTKFYSSNVEPKKISLTDGKIADSIEEYTVSSILYKEEDCSLLDEVCVDKPVILNVKVPHRVVLPDRIYPRITLTIKFNEDISKLIE